MKPEVPLVSIIIPVYNVGKYIAQTIHSVLGQSHENWELLLVDNNSTDDSSKVIAQFQDTRIRSFQEPQQGVSHARNRGLREMKGDFFCFLDGDDLFPKDSIRKRLEVFQQNEEISFVDGVVRYIDQAGNLLNQQFIPEFEGNPFPLLMKLSSSCFFGPSWMIRREANITYQFDVEMHYSEDLFFFMGISQEGLYSYSEEPILDYRVREGSAMTNLHGLEKGYAVLISKVRQKFKPGRWPMLRMKLKIIRVMFLSHLFDGKDPISAFKSIFRYLMK